MKLLHRYTKDGLNLLGCYWEGNGKDTCVVFTHGMFDNLLENTFAHVLGEKLSNNGYGFIFGHNRGYGVINNIIKRDPRTKKTSEKIIGSTFENFGEAIYDVELWLDEARKLGYSKIILAGHSFGCLKNLYYVSKKGFAGIHGFIFVSAPDSAGLIARSGQYEKMFLEADKNIGSGRAKRILIKKILGVFPISSRTMINLRKGSIADVFPLVENPEDFGVFQKINKPILMVVGEKDSVIVNSIEEDFKILKERALKCPDFTGKVIPDGTHRYIKTEKELSETITEWVKERF
ncbi:DUF1749 domain-containing protein [Fusobacterium perfoetens]|uniref:alpha/beta hydrolase n=1 Tax=Fusobacterium perfoetens TaxID=852 RepID=UPI0015A06082|nr:DUF1749 domain-containing protein [Fusobacterium perfoetens]MCF2624561.1 DUF1749 domain-containing protein [Fusobacterium perfoetens]